MTSYQIFALVLGVLGFGLGLINLYLRFLDRKPKLTLEIEKTRCCHGKWGVDKLSHTEQYENSFLGCNVRVSNPSPRDNSIVKACCRVDGHKLEQVGKDTRICIGTEHLDIPAIREKPVATGIYWKNPDDVWVKLEGKKVTPGGHVAGSFNYRIKGNPIPHGQKIQLKAIIRDAYGKMYTKHTEITASGYQETSRTVHV